MVNEVILLWPVVQFFLWADVGFLRVTSSLNSKPCTAGVLNLWPVNGIQSILFFKVNRIRFVELCCMAREFTGGLEIWGRGEWRGKASCRILWHAASLGPLVGSGRMSNISSCHHHQPPMDPCSLDSAWRRWAEFDTPALGRYVWEAVHHLRKLAAREMGKNSTFSQLSCKKVTFSCLILFWELASVGFWSMHPLPSPPGPTT